MGIPIIPVDYETNIPGMVINNVEAEVSDMNPTPMSHLVVDANVEIQVALEWDQAGTNPWTSFFLTGIGASWQAKATLHSVDGGTSATQSATVLYSGSPGTKKVVVSFPANTLAQGTYQLFLNCHLKSGVGDHLATSFVAQGRAVEVFDALLVPA